MRTCLPFAVQDVGEGENLLPQWHDIFRNEAIKQLANYFSKVNLYAAFILAFPKPFYCTPHIDISWL